MCCIFATNLEQKTFLFMLDFFKKFKFLGIVMAILSAIIITVFYNLLKVERQLPIYQPASVNAELVDSTIQHQKRFHKIADFSLTNQNGEIITQKDYQDKIYVADFFFTTCQTICPIMTKNMYEVLAYLGDFLVKQGVASYSNPMKKGKKAKENIYTLSKLKQYKLWNYTPRGLTDFYQEMEGFLHFDGNMRVLADLWENIPFFKEGGKR